MNTGEKARGLLGTITYHMVITLAVTLVLLGPTLWLWPEQSSDVSSKVFWWVPHGPITIEEIRALGGQLAGGAVVAFAVLLLERLAEDRFRRTERLREDQQREEERKRADERAEDERRRGEVEEERNFRLLIGLQKDLTGIDLEGRDLRSYFLRAKNLSDANLKRANLAGADLTRCRLVNITLSGATLTGTAFIGAEMHGALLPSATANAVRMQGALLNDAVLDYANLQGADFRGADLRRAWMQNCKSLEKADLRGAKLLETRVVDTTLDGVDLEEADFEGAYLIGVDLSSVYNLDKARLQGARYDDKVVWPAGFDHWSAGARPIGEYRNSQELLLDSYATRAPEALDSLGPEERRTVYSMLGLRVDALSDKSLRISGAFGEESLVCHHDRTSTR
jgi:uncharacterized protein YjbI with pentapeptide repeats